MSTVRVRAARAGTVVAIALGVACALGLGASGAGAVTGHAGSISVTVTPTSRVADGRTVDIHASAPTGTLIYQLRAHLCTTGTKLRTNFDFGFQGQRCTNLAVGSGDTEKTVEYGSGVSAGELTGFRIGAGRVQWVNELGYPVTIQCGPGHPCALVVRIQITDGTEFFTAPLCYGASCPAEGTNAPPPGHTSTTTTAPGSAPGGSQRTPGGAGAAANGGKGSRKSGSATGASGSGSASRSGPAASGSAAAAPRRASVQSGGSASTTRVWVAALAGLVTGGVVVGAYDRRRIRRAGVGIALLAIALVALTACSSSGHSGAAATGTTTTAPNGTATIASFVVPSSVQCTAAPSSTVKITYDVRRAKRQSISIDGLTEPALSAAKGTVTERVHCDGIEHTAAIVATDTHGAHTSKVKYFTTVLPGG